MPSDVDGGTEANRRHFRWIRSGVSFSGRERNCCFLNLGPTGPFADVSSVAGVDFPDDGRAIGRVDWDHDGDVDFWINNRSGPQVRFLRNDTPAANHFLALHLIGQSCNRDAIGARVEVACADDDNSPQIYTLRAGDGYLSQSSKWLHFGIGVATRIERLTVRWPDGIREEFRGAEVDRHFQLLQGTGRCEPWEPPPSGALTPSPLTEPASSNEYRVFLAAPVPMPPTRYRSHDGTLRDLPFAPHRALLINLWASWCRPCVDELALLAKHHQALAPHVDVLALSVDSLGDERGSEDDAHSLLEQLKPPFAIGWATDDLVGKIELIQQHAFVPIAPVAVPTSLLIDRSGQLAAIYSGNISVDQLLADIAQLDANPQQRRQHSIPLLGRWLGPPEQMALLPIAWDLVDGGWLDDGLKYIDRNQATLAVNPEYAKLLALTGYQLLERGDVARAITQYQASIARDPRTIVAHLNLAAALVRMNRYTDAIEQYRAALRYSPRDIRLYNGLAWLLATAEDAAVRDGAEAVIWAERAAKATGNRHELVLETLAAAYAESGNFPAAIATLERARSLAQETNDVQALGRIEQRLPLFQSGKPYHEPIPRD